MTGKEVGGLCVIFDVCGSILQTAVAEVHWEDLQGLCPGARGEWITHLHLWLSRENGNA